jgi:hypothetical protein
MKKWLLCSLLISAFVGYVRAMYHTICNTPEISEKSDWEAAPERLYILLKQNLRESDFSAISPFFEVDFHRFLDGAKACLEHYKDTISSEEADKIRQAIVCGEAGKTMSDPVKISNVDGSHNKRMVWHSPGVSDLNRARIYFKNINER